MRWQDEKGLWDNSCGVPCLIEPTQTWIEENQPQIDPPIMTEPIDEEKAALAEAVIYLSDQVDQLKTEIKILKGGSV